VNTDGHKTRQTNDLAKETDLATPARRKAIKIEVLAATCARWAFCSPRRLPILLNAR